MGRNAKPTTIDLDWGEPISILYEDRTVLAIDKPRGWMLSPGSWRETDRNLQAALVSSIAEGSYWARARNLKFLRYVHRLDAETTGILLFAKSLGALEPLSGLFESRAVSKVYLAVVRGVPREKEWVCEAALAPFNPQTGRVNVDERQGKPSETRFHVLATGQNKAGEPVALVEARPSTGRTHQIRVHLERAGLLVVGDTIYGAKPALARPSDFTPRNRRAGLSATASGKVEALAGPGRAALPPGAKRSFSPTVARVAPLGDFVAARRKQTEPLGLRSVQLSYTDPFTKRPVQIAAPVRPFLKEFGFGWLSAAAPVEHPEFRRFLDSLSGPKPSPRLVGGPAGKPEAGRSNTELSASLVAPGARPRSFAVNRPRAASGLAAPKPPVKTGG